jgi:ABC-type uncharacterized transport system substrate-binding protein
MAESTAKEMSVNGNSDKNKLKKTYFLIQQLINEIGKRLTVFDTRHGSEAKQSEHVFINHCAEEKLQPTTNCNDQTRYSNSRSVIEQ